MSFANVLGHKRIEDLMRTAIARNRLGHAYLFTGPDGVGKTLFALELAKALFCTSDGERPCDECADCRMSAHGGHPDLFLVEAAENKRFITIDQARELGRSLTLMPVRSSRRVAVIREAERMQSEAANALLKTLEEPSPFAHLILTTARPRALPSTIRSRCQEVRFAPLSTDNVRKALSSLAEADETELLLATQFAHGSPGRAVQVMESGCLEIFESVIGNIMALPEGDVFGLSDAIFDWAHSVSRKLEPQRQRLRELLRLVACVYRDLLLIKQEPSSESLICSFQSQLPAQLSERLTISRLLGVQDAICKARRQIDANASIRLVLETLLARIADLQDTKERAGMTG